MIKIIKETKPRAIKSYECDGARELYDMSDPYNDYDTYLMKSENCTGINPGDVYVSQYIEDDGKTITRRSCLTCHDSFS
jgi:hypothetical protein